MTLQERFIANVERMLLDLGWKVIDDTGRVICTGRSRLAHAMQATPQLVTDYLNGRSSPGLGVIARFAEALGVDPHELLMEPASETVAA